MWTIFALLFLGGCSTGIQSRVSFHSVNRLNPVSFFGKESWKRKYKRDHLNRLTPARRNLYTRLFNIKYREAFPLSTTLLVFLTDYYHACQFVTVNSFLLAVFLLSEKPLTMALAIWSVYHVGFYLTYYRK